MTQDYRRYPGLLEWFLIAAVVALLAFAVATKAKVIAKPWVMKEEQ